MNSNSVKFSITIPAYKGRFLYEAIESVLRQTYNNWELIIVDDCSPEGLDSIVKKFSDQRIRFYRNKKNCGAIDVVDNWNICLSYCRGDFVICMGDDDRLPHNCLEDYVKLINKYPLLDVYHAWTHIIDENGTVNLSLYRRKEYESVYSLISHRIKGDYQFIGDFCFRLSSLLECGGYYKLPLAWCSDDISSYRAAEKFGIANTQTICFEYRVSTITITKQVTNEIIDHKVKSFLIEKKWVEDLLKRTCVGSLDSEDKAFYFQIRDNLTKHISEEVSQLAYMDIQNRQRSLFSWILLFCHNGLSIPVLVKEILYRYCRLCFKEKE